MSEQERVEAVGVALGLDEGVAAGDAAACGWLDVGAADGVAVGVAVADLAGRAAGRLADGLWAAGTAWPGCDRTLPAVSVLATPERVKASMTRGDDSAAVSFAWLGWLVPVNA